ncbi:uncharacterized protein LACBIDRAFT_304792 [Laccaria bicolor S238N-H82]|uniref:Predicted protein n=1 Tax=Laccaria bicolor (strain S238N-H82 / ATCC MYA-4686) TaxID=486041 RepID=B0DMC5_LACBS|nr:uncharacterized protein LACBIDRAFT_304792 [Laccaria bicolor S238N-H82]EDR04169.1 predicted protein [Laccaria bicolor S238N-H82]|eukprot:XP_001885060.1 predicted protein [Laccaria bicolor S238N-H82]
MRSSTSFALIALALGATAMALPMDSYTDLAERDESFDLETRMFETEDLDARDFDWEDELVARQESTTPTETTPTPESPGAGAPGASLATGGRKHRHHKGKGFRHGHGGHRNRKGGRRHRKHGKGRHGRKGAKKAALIPQENPAPPTTVSTEASPALAAREPEPFSLFGLGKKKHATKVEETTPSNLKANSTSDPEPATPSASASGTPKKKHRKHRKHRKNGKHGKNARKHRKHKLLRLHKHKLDESTAANATTSAV